MRNAYNPKVGLEELIRSKIRDVSDYPKPGIVFKDITPLLKDSATFSMCIDELSHRLSKSDFDYLAVIESRGFLVGAALSYCMKKGLVLVRKKGKLPYKKLSRDYVLEYGVETIEMHSDSIEKDSRVVIVDDLLATGGTAAASASLIKDLGGTVAGYAFIVELSFLNGRQKLGDENITSLVRY